jgi:hypothetical protein
MFNRKAARDAVKFPPIPRLPQEFADFAQHVLCCADAVRDGSVHDLDRAVIGAVVGMLENPLYVTGKWTNEYAHGVRQYQEQTTNLCALLWGDFCDWFYKRLRWLGVTDAAMDGITTEISRQKNEIDGWIAAGVRPSLKGALAFLKEML